ncbi:MAG TPA: sigma factor, partial [Solirubrobacteraceae bacterium]
MAQFETAYRANVGGVSAFFARRYPDPQTVADLTSETFVQAIGSFGSFDPGRGSVRGWLFGIARRVNAQHREGAVNGQDAARRLAGRRQLAGDDIGELEA